MNKAHYLESVIDSYKISKEEKLLEKYKTKRDEVKRALEEKYKGNIYSPLIQALMLKTQLSTLNLILIWLLHSKGMLLVQVEH